MNWSHVDRLLINCSKRPGLDFGEADPRFRDYAEFLLRHDGAEGFIGSDQYIMLWSAFQLRELNAAYRVSDLMQGVVLIGTDGGDTAFGIDEATGRYLSVPIVGMSREMVRDEGASFEEFLESRASQNSIGSPIRHPRQE